MKLISMHVDDFGGLHNYNYNFDEGLNVVLHDNGWGKTTMASFLKAMLYGFDSKRSKDITENERRRYFPWQGGTYGGSLDFEADGVHYRIYRTFGETPRFDKVKIVNVDKKTTAKIDPEKIGETLFRLDASAFQRSVFINQNGLSIDGAASSIHTRLNALVSQANDVAAYDEAIAKLSSQIKIFEKTGSRGQIGDITRQIAALEHQRDKFEADLAAQDDARSRISQIDILLSSISEDIEKKKKKLDEVSGEAKKREAAKKLLDDINNQVAQLQVQIDTIKADLGGRIPTQEEIDSVKRQKQTAAALTIQIQELKENFEKLSADYNGLLEKYNGSMPTVSQLDEMQGIYGELQGILSTGSEEQDAAGTIPDGYAEVKAAADQNADYIKKLTITVGSQMTLQQLIRKLESQDRDIQQEENSWAERKKRFAALSEETERLQTEVDGQQQYAPSVLEPVIAGISDLQKKQQILSQKKTSKQAEIDREKTGWADKKKRYAALRAEADEAHSEVVAVASYCPEKVDPILRELEDIQKKQQLIDVKVDSLTALTPEQETVLAEYCGVLPDADEGNRILKQYRSASANRAEAQRLSSILEGEKSKADSLRVSLDQFGTVSASTVSPVEEPKKPAGGAMIGIGSAIAVIGAVLIFMITPVMAVAAVIGAVLAAVGVVSNQRYKSKLQAYEAYQEAAGKQREIDNKKAEIQVQMNSVMASVAELEKKIADLINHAASDETAVAAWLHKWQSEAEPSETAISQVMDNAENVRKLRKKKQEIAQVQESINLLRNEIAELKADILAQYPGLADKSTSDSLSFLRSAETDYKIKLDKQKTAVRNLERFIAEAKVPEKQFEEEESPRIAELQTQLIQIESGIESFIQAAKTYEMQYPEIAGMSCDDALALLRGKLSTYKVSDGQLRAAIHAQQKYLADIKVSQEQLTSEDSPRILGMISQRDATAKSINEMLSRNNDVLMQIGLNITTENAQGVLRKAEHMLNAYKQQEDKLKGRADRQQRRQKQIEQLQSKLASKLPSLQGRFPDLDVPERLALVRENVADAGKLREKIREIEEDKRKQTVKLSDASAAVEKFLTSYGVFTPESDDLLAEICTKAAMFTEVMAAIQQLEKQRASVGKDQGTGAHEVGAEETELKTQIANLEGRRDTLLVEYTQKADFIRQADLSLEQYPDVVAQIRQLYDQKQKAMGTLAMLKRTIHLITKAKENLADRYLSKVEQLFNNYMHIWLNNEAVRGILDIDFNITIEENDKTHVAEGYSTGYCDLIDFCMRLALVDTLFESEQPFLILDDPFVNLDADRLDKALELLNVMAANKQIVYFVCHPIRAVEANTNSASRAEFIRLAESTRKTIEGRQAVNTGRKLHVHKSPKDLYRVTTGSAPLAFKPAKPDYVITNNIFSLNFVMNGTATTKDVSYELFFIDVNGRVLNDRQLIEIKDGKISAQRIRFCLNTRDDSGNQYELMVRESGQDDFEVAARIPFKAKLAFTGTDSFEL